MRALSLKNSSIFLPILLVLITAFIGFGIIHLGKFHTADEDLWFANPTEGRIHTYWNAFKNGEWEKTRVNDKPGITAALVSGSIGLLYDTEPEKKVIEYGSYWTISNPEINERTAFFFRLPLLLFNAALIVCVFFLLRTLTKKIFLSLIFVSFLFLSPTLIGISQIVNPDATLWSLGAVSLLSYLALLKTKKRKYLFYTILSGGFALLSKYVAVFLLLFFFFVTLSRLLFFFDSKKSDNLFRKETKRTLLYFPSLIIGTLVVFSLGMPAVFENPSFLYAGTLGFAHGKNLLLFGICFLFGIIFLSLDTFLFKNTLLLSLRKVLHPVSKHITPTVSVIVLLLAFFTLGNWTFHNPLHLPTISFDSARSERFSHLFFVQKFLFELRPILFTLPPVALFFFLLELTLIPFIPKKKKSFLRFSLLSFLLLFLCAMVSQNLLMNARYGILLYPPILLLSALGALSFFHFIRKKIPKFSPLLFLGLLFGIEFFTLFSAKPFYLVYSNPLLPKTEIVTTTWGQGGYEAAQYLNALPNAKSIVAWTDYEGFCNFFVGKCTKGRSILRAKEHSFEHVDYYIVSRRGKQVQKVLWAKVQKDGLVEKNPLWSISPLGQEKNSVRIYKGTSDSNTKDSE